MYFHTAKKVTHCTYSYIISEAFRVDLIVIVNSSVSVFYNFRVKVWLLTYGRWSHWPDHHFSTASNRDIVKGLWLSRQQQTVRKWNARRDEANVPPSARFYGDNAQNAARALVIFKNSRNRTYLGENASSESGTSVSEC